LRFDQSIALDGFYTRQEYPQHLRRVGFVDPETGKRLIFLTNHFGLPALTIAALYKRRWQVELFFKWIKQNIRERGEDANLDGSVRLRARRHRQKGIGARCCTLHFFTDFVRQSVHSFEKIPILQAFSQNDPSPAPITSTKQLNLFNT